MVPFTATPMACGTSARMGGRTYVASNGTDIDLPESSGALPVVDFAHAGHVYLPLGEQGIYHTSDFGSSWTRVSREGVWPSLLTVGAPAQGRTNPALYIWGTISANGTTGLYRSDDNGAGWVRINDDAHQYGGPGLIQGDPRVYGRVYIGTGGRGIVRADVVASMSTAGGVVPGTGGI
jgi:oligoxyloglucan reducing-end-specific cellobiohydrolase